MKEPYTTSDTSLAAYLHYNGHQVLGYMIDKYDKTRKVYVFVKQDDTDDLANEYDTKKITVHPKGYYKSIREMHKTLIHGKEIK